jgi:heat shock protein HslJ
MITLRPMHAAVAAAVLIAGLAGAALGADEPEPESSVGPVGIFSIEGMDWLLTAQLVDGVMTPVPDGVIVSLSMEDGRASGNGGCNSYFASYSIDGFALSFSDIGSTLMACIGPSGDVEAAYLANLGLVASYQSGGIEMALKDSADQFLLEFDLAPIGSVVGSWVAQGINNGAEAVVSSALTSSVTAVFSEDGTLAGDDGCNTYATTYELDAERMNVSPAIVTTRKACRDEELAQQSVQYFDALAAATTWSVDVQGSLELRDDSGALQVRFAPTEP